MLALSYSAVSTYEQCPRKFYECNILKKHPYVATPENTWGNEVHAALESAVRNRVELPRNMQQFQPIVEAVLRKPGTKYAEVQLAIDWHGNATKYFGHDVWMRGKGDLIVVNNEDGLVIDYKTGKDNYPDEEQIDLMAIMSFAKFPQLKRIKGMLMYVVAGSIFPMEYTRDQFEGILAHWQKKGARIEQSRAMNVWVEKPSGLCGWCPCTTCPHWRDSKKKA